MHCWKYLTLDDSKRILVVSDIHGNLSSFKNLLKEVHYKEGEDYLFLLGDLFEKGDEPLATFDYIYSLSKANNVFITVGNCEHLDTKAFWKKNLALFKRMKNDSHTLVYGLVKRYLENHSQPLSDAILQMNCRKAFDEYFHFINTLPKTIETNDYIFVHAALYPNDSFRKTPQRYMTVHRYFMNTSYHFPKMVICGHFPTVIYKVDHFDNGIIQDFKTNITSIDGGNVVQVGGILNLLEIKNHKYFFHYNSNGIKKAVLEDSSPYQLGKGLCWPDFEIEEIEKGVDFSKVKVVTTNKIAFLKNEWIHRVNDKTFAKDDCPAEILELHKGEEVLLISDKYSGYDLVRKGTTLGWCKKGVI